MNVEEHVDELRESEAEARVPMFALESDEHRNELRPILLVGVKALVIARDLRLIGADQSLPRISNHREGVGRLLQQSFV